MVRFPYFSRMNNIPLYIYVCVSVYVCGCACSVTQLYPTFCNPMDYSLPGSSVCGIFQKRILEQVAISYSRKSSRPRDWTCVSCVSCTGRQILYHRTTWDPHVYINICVCVCLCVCVCVYGLVAKSCPTLCDPMDCSPWGSSILRIFQAGILEWVVIPFSRGSLWSRDQTRSPAR